MNPVVLGLMAAISAIWLGVGYEVIRQGAWLSIALYVVALIAATNPRLWWR